MSIFLIDRVYFLIILCNIIIIQKIQNVDSLKIFGKNINFWPFNSNQDKNKDMVLHKGSQISTIYHHNYHKPRILNDNSSSKNEISKSNGKNYSKLKHQNFLEKILSAEDEKIIGVLSLAILFQSIFATGSNLLILKAIVKAQLLSRLTTTTTIAPTAPTAPTAPSAPTATAPTAPTAKSRKILT